MIDRERVIRHITAEISIAKTCKKDFASVDIDMLSDALALLEDYDTQLQYRDDHIAMYQAEIKRLEALLKEQGNEYENGFNDAMLGKQELRYEGTDGKWHKNDW